MIAIAPGSVSAKPSGPRAISRSSQGHPATIDFVYPGRTASCVDTASVSTYPAFMNITLAIDERLVRRARKKAHAMGKSLNQLVREYLERLAGSDDAERDVAELRRLSRESRGRTVAIQSRRAA